MISILCFFHAPCNDGSAAAVALGHRLHCDNYLDGEFEIRFCPLSYNTEWDEPMPENYLENEIVPDHRVSEIYFVDIAMSEVKFRQLIEHLRSIERLDGDPRVVCIDHHKTALEKLDELEKFCDETYIKIGPGLSGATLVWNYFNDHFDKEHPTPTILRYIADQDIWEWKLPDSREINAALNVLDGHLDATREEFENSLENEEEWMRLRRVQGSAILSMVDAQVKKSAWHAASIDAGTFTMKVINSASFSSELGNYVCEHSDESPNVVAFIYSIQEDWSLRCSIRSIPGGSMLARTVAERFGGGGHDHAAGCRFKSFEELRSMLREIEEHGWDRGTGDSNDA